MPAIIYVPRKLPGLIRCPVDANPPVTLVKWEKDGYPLRVEKVSARACDSSCTRLHLSWHLRVGFREIYWLKWNIILLSVFIRV